MGLILRLAGFLVSLLAVCAASGCTIEEQMALGMIEPPPFVRTEHLCAAMSSGNSDLEAIKKDLGNILGHVQSGIIVKYYKRHDASADRMWELVAGSQNLQSITHPNGQVDYINLATIQVSDSRMTVSNQIYFDFDELVDRVMDFNAKAVYASHPYNVQMDGVIRFSFADRELAQCVAEELTFIQQALRKKQQDELTGAFQAVVDQYRAMPAKPSVSEEQRKYIVQANALTQKKEFAKALALYEKALEVNPFSYPAAHYNMALISAQQGRYFAAIISMKKYLMLAPEAEDARSAQDKIYEWEALGGGQ